MPLSRFLLTAASIALLPLAASAQEPVISTPEITRVAPPAGSSVTREELPALIREILINDPKILMDALQSARDKQLAEARQKAKDALASKKDALHNDPGSPSIGDAAADVTIVEFFDYHCGYCKQLLPALTQLVENDKKVRVVFKEYPILSEDSVTASQAAIAAHRIAPDKYFAYHTALMAHNGRFDEATLLDLAKKAGIDADKLKAEMAKPETKAQIDKNRELGDALGVRGTPLMVIGNEMLPGALDLDQMKAVVTAVRNGVPLDPALLGQ